MISYYGLESHVKNPTMRLSPRLQNKKALQKLKG